MKTDNRCLHHFLVATFELTGKPALTRLATFASCVFIHSERFFEYSIAWTVQFLMASLRKSPNTDRLQTVLFSKRFVIWERENQFPIFNVIWISFSVWSTDEKKFIKTIQFFPFSNLYKSINNGQKSMKTKQ